MRDPSKKGGFFLWWRQLPKEVQSEQGAHDPVQEALWRGVRNQSAVSLAYKIEPDKEEFTLLLYPREIYKRGGHLYVEGRCYPSGNYQTLRVDRIVSAKPVGRSTPKSAPSRLPTILKIILGLLLLGWLLHLMGR